MYNLSTKYDESIPTNYNLSYNSYPYPKKVHTTKNEFERKNLKNQYSMHQKSYNYKENYKLNNYSNEYRCRCNGSYHKTI